MDRLDPPPIFLPNLLGGKLDTLMVTLCRIRELSFFTGRGAVCLWGGPEFFGLVKGGGTNFS